MLKAISRVVFSQRTIIVFLLLLQIGLLLFMVVTTSQSSDWTHAILNFVSLLVVLYIFSIKDKPAFKLSWVFLILAFPVFGGLFYLLFSFQSSTAKARRKHAAIEAETRSLFVPPEDVLPELPTQCPNCAPPVQYLQEYVGFPVYQNTQAEYLSSGEAKFERMLEELEKAEHYIFLEYFIVEPGVMWDSILEILKEKAQQGVDVRFIYDDMGCILRLPSNYTKILAEYGIKSVAFNKFRPVLSTLQNNRDHRKIAVIDGITAFTGGVNLADEYINVKERFGHWKDAAIMVKGQAAWSMTLMFLQMWQVATGEEVDSSLRPWDRMPEFPSDGFVQPYADSPLDDEHVSEHVYMGIINSAKNYLYIVTPYLIIEDAMLSALERAAKSGIDVRIITPHRWDKRYVHITTRSYYRDLIEAGVRIYEYTKGFIHSKTFVADDTVATVGTTNLDYRSLYLHFECGVWLYNSSAVMDVKQDFEDTLAKSHEISLEECRGNAFYRLIQDILRIFAPLM